MLLVLTEATVFKITKYPVDSVLMYCEYPSIKKHSSLFLVPYDPFLPLNFLSKKFLPLNFSQLWLCGSFPTFSLHNF